MFSDKSKRITSVSLCCLHGSSCCRLLCVLALVLAKSFSATLSSAVKDCLAVLIHLQLDNGDLAGVDTNINCGSVGFFSLDPLNVDPELGPVALDYLANLLTLVVTTDNLKCDNGEK